MLRLAIYGASGLGREVMALARSQAFAQGLKCELDFIDDGQLPSVVNGQRVMSFASWLEQPADNRLVAIAIADSGVREKLANRCLMHGVGFFEVRALNAVLLDEVSIGEGAILLPFSMISSNVSIGKHFHCNYYSYVAHDCRIGDFVTFAPSVRCNGNVIVQDHAYIGANAVIRQGKPGRPLTIGKAAVVGMGAVVTKDVPPGVTVVGNPARPLVR